MERPATWKVVTLGAALTGLSVAGVGAAQVDTGTPGSGPVYVSPAPLFDEPRLLASGSGGGSGHRGDWGWGNWGPGWGGVHHGSVRARHRVHLAICAKEFVE